jgi:hypothetical protein
MKELHEKTGFRGEAREKIDLSAAVDVNIKCG